MEKKFEIAKVRSTKEKEQSKFKSNTIVKDYFEGDSMEEKLEIN